MAKAKSVVEANPMTDFASLKDMGYKQAKTSDTLEVMARYALSKIKGFPESIDDESKDQLYSGYQLRYQENKPAIEYAYVNGHYEPVTEETPKSLERMTLTVAHVFSYTQQQFGRLKAENNAKYELIKPLREEVNKYCSNRLADLKKKAKSLTALPRERKATADFEVTLKEVLDNLTTRCINASKRGDATANKDRLSRAKVAFMVEWNKA